MSALEDSLVILRDARGWGEFPNSLPEPLNRVYNNLTHEKAREEGKTFEQVRRELEDPAA